MLNRLALVIHWICFLIGIGYLAIIGLLVFGGVEISSNLLDRIAVILLGLGGLFLANLIGFIIRFVLTDERAFTPWR